MWTYRTDLSVQLTASTLGGTTSGLCLSAPLPHSVGETVVLAACAALGSSPPEQIFAVDDQAKLNTTADGSTIDGYCVNFAGKFNHAALTLQPCSGGGFDTSEKLQQSNKGGTGSAGAGLGQLVNFDVFNGCLNIPGSGTTSSPYLDVEPCAQRAQGNHTVVPWYQIFKPTVTLGNGATPTMLATAKINGNKYCLRSAQTEGGYATVVLCPATTPPAPSPYIWNMYQTRDTDGTALPYSRKYTIVDSSTFGTTTPLCLDLGSVNDMNGSYYKVVTSRCDGSAAQKWNADPSFVASSIQTTTEH
jgi:hypothetical protein